MVLETEPKNYINWEQFEFLKRRKREGPLQRLQLTAPLWLNARQAKELGYNQGEEDYLLEAGQKLPTIPTVPTVPTAIPETALGGDFGKLYQEYLRTGGKLDVVQWGAAGAPLREDIGQSPSQEGLEQFLGQLAEAGQTSDIETILRQIGFSEEQIDEAIGIEERQREFEDLVAKTFPLLDLASVYNLMETKPDEFIRQIKAGGWTKEKENLLRLVGMPDEEIAKTIAPPWTLDFWKNQFFQPYGGEDIKGKLAASFIAGIGDVIKISGGTARWLGFEQAGSVLSTIGSTLGQVAPPDTTGEFEITDLLNPDWYNKIARAIPFSLMLLPLAIGGFGVGSAIATALGVGRLGSMIIGGFASAGLSRPLESAMEAGGVFDDAMARGKTEAEAKKEADEVFRNNMTLAGADAFEIAIALAPTPKWVPTSLVKAGLVRTARISGKMVIVGLSEGGEELFQDMITRHAAGEEWKLDPVSKEVFAIGMVMGVGGGLGGDVMSGVVDRAQAKMSKELRGQFIKRIADFKMEGFTIEQAEARALNEIAQTPEGEKVVSEAIKAEAPESAVLRPKEVAIPTKPTEPAPTPTKEAVVTPPEKVTPAAEEIKPPAPEAGMPPSISVQTGLPGIGVTAAQAKFFEEVSGKTGRKVPLTEVPKKQAEVLEGQQRFEEAQQKAEEASEAEREAYEAQVEIEALKVTHKLDPVASWTTEIKMTRKTKQPDGSYKLTQYTRRVGFDFFISIKEQEFPEYFTVKQAQMIDPNADWSKYTQKGLPTYNKVPRDSVLDSVVQELGFDYTGGKDDLVNRIMAIRREKARIRELENYVQTGSQEIFPGITAVEPMPEAVEAVEGGVPPTIPPEEQLAGTVDVPVPPPSPDARTRIIRQSDEVVKQSLPGALNQLFQKIPGIKQAMQFERPALLAFAEGNQLLVTAQVAEVAAKSDVAARQVATRLPLFKKLHDVFGEKALRGEKVEMAAFMGTEEQKNHPLTWTLLDVAQNPELYPLTPTQLNALQAINEHNDASLNYVVNQYGAEIGRFAPKPDGAFLSNVDIDEGIIDWLGSETRAIAQGRGKTRYWQTARDRMTADKTFKPEMDVKRLIDGMDSFKASAAGGISFREAVAGKTRLEAMEETHPALFNRMTSLKKELQSLQGSLKRLESRLADRVTEFLGSPVEDADLATLQDELDVKLERGIRAGLDIETTQALIDGFRAEIKDLRPAWKVANLKPFVFVQEGLYRYFPADQAQYIIQSRKTTSNPMLNFVERWRGQAFSGDFSPFAIQGSIGVLADPAGSLQATAGGIKKAFETRDFTHSFTIDGLIDDVNSDVEGWAEFASLMGRTLTGTPREYAAGFLSSIPGFDKFTERTYLVVTRGTKNLYDRTWQGLVKSGVPLLEAKVAAIEQAQKVYPLVNPAKLGQSQARASVLRAIPTSYSFIRQPASLISQASMGYAKLATFQKLSPQERVAVRQITTMAASILITSATSAAISAWAQGKDDDEIWQAVLDAINPDPYNGKFASIIIGEFRIPLGGPYRAIFRAVYPQEVKGIPFPVPFAGIPNFVFNRITPAIKTQINLLRNKDYYGKQIVKGQFPENIIRGLLYELEGALPLSAGELMGGVRREEFPEEIGQQAAAQFVGVNLIKLDNTYFHKLVRNLGLPTQETPSPYSLERPRFLTTNLYGKVTSVLSDETLDEIKKRKGYPKLVAVIIEARDLKREVDLLPNYSPVSLNADPARDNGITYKVLYQQWSDRQALVLAGDDAEWHTQELVGGQYKTRTNKGEAALKAFDRENPKAELGNMSQTQYVLLEKYHSITDKKEQAQFLKDHPELSVIPRTDYLKTHPKENAQLAVWGQAKILTKEAYNEFKRLIKEYDIPDSAIPEMTLPPEGSIDNYFQYQDMENKNSWEAQLMLAKDADLLKFLDRQPIDTPIASLELKVKNREHFDAYDELETDAERKQYKLDNPDWVDDTRRIEAIERGTEKIPSLDTVIKAHVDYGKLIDKEGVGSSSAETMLYRVDNPDYDRWRQDVNVWGDQALKPVDQTKIPIWRIDVKYEKEDAEYDALPITGTTREDYLAKNEAYRKNRRRREAYQRGLAAGLIEPYVSYYELPVKGFRQERFLFNNPDFAKALGLKVPEKVPSERYDELLEMEERTPEQEFEMDAYKMFVPDELVTDYVSYKTLPKGTYEDDWFLMEHQDFYKQVYLGILGNKRKDYRKVPTREVGAKYLHYQSLLYGEDRDQYRLDNSDLDEWGVLAGIWTKTMSEQRRRLGLSASEKMEEEVQKIIDKMRGVGVRR